MTSLNEIKRLQKLAGILKEEDSDDRGIEILRKGLDALKQGASSIKPSENESIIATGLGLVASFPGFIKLAGHVVDIMSSLGSHYQVNSTGFGTWLKVQGDKFEHAYIKTIEDIILKAKPELKADPKKLEMLSKGVYAAILTAFAAKSGIEAHEAAEQVHQAVEGGLASIKTKEVEELAAEILSGGKES